MKQRTFLSFVKVILGAALLLPAVSLQAQTLPDNTKVNKEDRSTAAPNADKAKNNLSDRELMAHIRRDIVKDKSLSTYAHNIKIVSSQGKVTLRGPVHSDQEKQSIEQYAKKYAGDENVTDELTVKGDTK
jgi:osmotically-inducible protein OsmY